MREWLVGGAVLVGPEGLLLVRNRRRDGSFDWTPPGGVIDPDDVSITDGIAREVAEETGLVITGWEGLLYEVVAHAPAMGWTMRVEAWLASGWTGEMSFDDPDGIVETAAWVPLDRCGEHLDHGPLWVAEPVLGWMADRWIEPRTFTYHVEGSSRSSSVITRM